jgi:hypothetical protein
MKGIQYMSDHEIPLAIGLLKGISWVPSYYNTDITALGYSCLIKCQVILGMQLYHMLVSSSFVMIVVKTFKATQYSATNGSWCMYP